MKVYGFSEPNRTGYVNATAYICGGDEEITWSPIEKKDYILTHSEMAEHGLPRELTVRFRLSPAAAANLFDDVVFDIAIELLADMYPEWSPMLGDNVSIYEDDPEEKTDSRVDPRNEPEDAGLYDVMEQER